MEAVTKETATSPYVESVSHSYGGLSFYIKERLMGEIKNVIETIVVDGKEMAIERRSDNVWVNMTQMAIPFGKNKLPTQWLRTKEAHEYLAALSVMHKCRTADLVIVRQGGTPQEQGTWCTDYRIAMRFAQWLDMKYSIQVDSLLVQIANGEKIVSDVLPFDGKNYISQSDYCRTLECSYHSFFGLKSHFPTEYIYVLGVWYVSMKLYRMKEADRRIRGVKADLRKEKDKWQLKFEFQ
ncbi:KilA-N domain-containing protein [Bacteroides caccae]|jgi:hypothetical protein|uniref:KilA-N domain-containing protein n=1 Tax=Bacteroides caccae TaxID=47678 RepID=UPI0002FD0112|nr:KilA-N domain-containing protein [Bacteroides caccae]MDC7282153.1 KilA-N domain-containing protein [Bacteroides caccae]QQT76670.1 KilA-N domain-containing protein [Bacteroides caccae]QRP58080.1 KilA-N domain-containing protein [Bacteroides caccae]UWN77529.1 KilA-N domain-containing protein [Bacteroides caccae]